LIDRGAAFGRCRIQTDGRNSIMSQSGRRVVLASRPVGEPNASDFRIEDYPIPTPGDGEVLLRTIWLSLDPYMRGRMSEGPSYAAPVPINGVMEGERSTA